MSERKDFGQINLLNLRLRGTYLDSFTLELNYKDYSIIVDKSSFQRGKMIGSIKVINPNGIDTTRTFLRMESINKTPSGDKIYATPENLIEVMKNIPIQREVKA